MTIGGRVPVLELESVTKTYGSTPPVRALDDVSFVVEEGELVAILGPSGSGKSTLLQLAGTLDRPTSGTVRITGTNVAELSDRELAGLRANRIGFVFQQFHLEERTTLLGNVANGLLYAGVAVQERRERAAEALAAVGLGDRTRSLPTQLSGGQRQRVAIARALAGRPAILLADEPTGNLDSVSGNAVLELMEALNAQGVTIVVITHDRSVADRFDRRIEVLDGRIVHDSAIADASALLGGAAR